MHYAQRSKSLALLFQRKTLALLFESNCCSTLYQRQTGYRLKTHLDHVIQHHLHAGHTQGHMEGSKGARLGWQHCLGQEAGGEHGGAEGVGDPVVAAPPLARDELSACWGWGRVLKWQAVKAHISVLSAWCPVQNLEQSE